MWEVKHHHGKDRWNLAGRYRKNPSWMSGGAIGDKPLSSIPVPLAQPAKPHRKPKPDEPLAFCADCREWTPMQWFPADKRGKSAEQWFQCEHCHGCNLTLQYLSGKEVVKTSIGMRESIFVQPEFHGTAHPE